jgi:hypothetical protein
MLINIILACGVILFHMIGLVSVAVSFSNMLLIYSNKLFGICMVGMFVSAIGLATLFPMYLERTGVILF